MTWAVRDNNANKTIPVSISATRRLEKLFFHFLPTLYSLVYLPITNFIQYQDFFPLPFHFLLLLFILFFLFQIFPLVFPFFVRPFLTSPRFPFRKRLSVKRRGLNYREKVTVFFFFFVFLLLPRRPSVIFRERERERRWGD